MSGIEGLPNIYPPNDRIIDGPALDAYISNLPIEETFNVPAETIKSPGTIAERLARIAEAARHIEVDRKQIAYHASVLSLVLEQSPETIEGLPDDQRARVMEIISRLRH